MNWTYTTLKSAIQDYVESADSTFVSNLPIFIQEAEQRILQNVQIPVFRKNVTGSGTSGNTYLAAPSDFLTPLSLAVIDGDSNYNYLLLKHVSFIRDYTPAAATTGEPKYYAIFDNNTFLLAPTPNTGFTFELHYVYRPESITERTAKLDFLTQARIVLGGPKRLTKRVAKIFEERFINAVNALSAMFEGLGNRDEYRYDNVRGNMNA